MNSAESRENIELIQRPNLFLLVRMIGIITLKSSKHDARSIK